MKRKRFAAFLMAAMLLLCAGSAQAVGNKLLGNIKYGVPVPYENRVYGYSLDVYSRFDMFGDAKSRMRTTITSMMCASGVRRIPNTCLMFK